MLLITPVAGLRFASFVDLLIPPVAGLRFASFADFTLDNQLCQF